MKKHSYIPLSGSSHCDNICCSRYSLDKKRDTSRNTNLAMPPHSNLQPPLLHPYQDGRNDSSLSLARNLTFVDDDVESICSDLDSAPSITASSKKSSRSKTVFSICYPPQGNKQTKSRSLLQLHKLNASTRPTPAFELVPLAKLPSSVPKDFVKTHSSKPNLGSTDLAVLKAEDYERASSKNGSSQDVLALICKSRKGDGLAPGSGKILLSDGKEWTARLSSKGSYEFVNNTEHGLATTVRWVLKRPGQGSRSISAPEELLPLASDADSLSQKSDADASSPQILSPRVVPPSTKKYNFSIISPHTRRHPVLAHLSSTKMDIQESYTATSPVDDGSKADAVEVTPEIRTLITTTAIWIAIREGWCPGYRSEDAAAARPVSRADVGSAAKVAKPEKPVKSMTMAVDDAAAVDSALGQVVKKDNAISRAWRKAFG